MGKTGGDGSLGQKQLHPQVLKFKEFVKAHPKIIQEVNNKDKTLQEFFEEWYLLGEEDPLWDKYKEKAAERSESEKQKSSKWTETIFTSLKKIDPNQLQEHLYHMNQAIGALQNLLAQFQTNSSATPSPKQSPNRPEQSFFGFRKD
ncbi:spore coat protein YlbD [Bacillus smithii]|uniref:spore coat protein YlbD n=1 Tax=Bacillus smithii TaxID=1479 RepID=UPI003D1DC13A